MTSIKDAPLKLRWDHDMEDLVHGPGIYQLKSKPASAFITYNNFVAICYLLYQKQALSRSVIVVLIQDDDNY